MQQIIKCFFPIDSMCIITRLLSSFFSCCSSKDVKVIATIFSYTSVFADSSSLGRQLLSHDSLESASANILFFLILIIKVVVV